MGEFDFHPVCFTHVRQWVLMRSNDAATTSCWTMTSRSSHSPKDIVSWELDTAAHYVSFKAMWTKSISNPTAIEDLPIIYQRMKRKKTTNESNSLLFTGSLLPNKFSFSLFSSRLRRNLSYDRISLAGVCTAWQETRTKIWLDAELFCQFLTVCPSPPSLFLAQLCFLCCETQCSV